MRDCVCVSVCVPVCCCSLTPVSKHMECLSLPKSEYNRQWARWHGLAFDAIANLQPNRSAVWRGAGEKCCFDSTAAVMDHFNIFI